MLGYGCLGLLLLFLDPAYLGRNPGHVFQRPRKDVLDQMAGISDRLRSRDECAERAGNGHIQMKRDLGEQAADNPLRLRGLPNPGSIVPMVGASGAISGVLGAYMLLYPRARVLLGLPLGFLIVELGRFPAVWVLLIWFLMQLFMGGLSLTRPPGAEGGGIAFGAHAGGFVAGLLLVTLFKRRGVPLWRQH